MSPTRRLAALFAALLFLNASLTFANIWPTPAIRWRSELSFELAVCLLGLALAIGWSGQPSRRALRWLSAFWVLLIVGRYADVTAPALYGRDINLYWDLRHIPNVAAMLARVAPAWVVALVVAGAAAILTFLYVLVRWAFGRVAEGLSGVGTRLLLSGLAAAAAILFVGQRVSPAFHGTPEFSLPVTQSYARQIRLIADALMGSKSLPPSPPMNSDLARLKQADVFLVFIESYGATTYDRPEFAQRLAASREELEAAIRATRREVVSAYVESPTFGGVSWLAHLSLMSGLEVRDPHTNALLMTENRQTLVTTFKRHGYRAVALMPGLWDSWPEGAFYGFDQIYDGKRLSYRGPPFGWWSIPDQFALARIDALEVNRSSRAPLFMFFSTISTHTPFSPAPPYQPDWARVSTEYPYDQADVKRAWLETPDWMNLGPSYIKAMTYSYQTLAGYLRAHADHDFVMIVLGDHQPPTAVAGEGVRWDVPVHVIATLRPILDRLSTRGFHAGLRPQDRAIGPMHTLLPILLDAFGDSGRSATSITTKDTKDTKDQAR